MKIEIRQEELKQLVQCVYLGNLVINGHRKDEEVKSEYSDFADSVFKRIIGNAPQTEPRFKFAVMPNEKSTDTLLADMRDRIADSVKGFYDEFRQALFNEVIETL